MYYFIFHRINKYLLNKIKWHGIWIQTEILFKQIFITILNSTNSSSRYTLYNFDINSITSQFHIYKCPHYISLTLVFCIQLHSSLNPASEQSAKIFTNAVKLKKKYFCNIKWNTIFWKYDLPQLFGLFVIIHIWIRHTRTTCDIHSVSL